MPTIETTLTPWRPGLGMTAFDGANNYAGETLDGWFVLSQHRDSDAIARSNFECLRRDLEQEAEKAGAAGCVETHSFGHWAVGHVDQIVLTAETPEPVIRFAENALARLADYPIYDDDHASDLEFTEAADYWDSLSPRDKVEWAIDQRKRCHWLKNEPVWHFGRMSYDDLVNANRTPGQAAIARAIEESLRNG